MKEEDILLKCEWQVKSAANRFNVPDMTKEDLKQVGRLAVVKAARTFDAEKGDLTSHVYRRIRSEVGRAYVSQFMKHNHVPLFDEELWQEDCPETKEYLDILSGKELEITLAYFGIGCVATSMADIARGMGISRERVRQYKERALAKMRAVALDEVPIGC